MTTQTRTKQKTEDRQAELVQAALRLAALRSPVEITTGDLAQVIGITQGGVFKHFESKEAIWLAVLEWAHQTLIRRLKEAAAQHVGEYASLQALRAVFMAHIEFVQQYPGVPRLVFQELQHARATPLKGKVQALMADYRQLLARLMAQARDDGDIASHVDLTGAVVLFVGAIQGLVMQSLITGNLQGMGQQAQTVFTIYAAGLTEESNRVQRTRK